MKYIFKDCKFCEKETKQTAVVESYLDSSGEMIFIHYWTRCLECGENIISKLKEIDWEQL